MQGPVCSRRSHCPFSPHCSNFSSWSYWCLYCISFVFWGQGTIYWIILVFTAFCSVNYWNFLFTVAFWIFLFLKSALGLFLVLIIVVMNVGPDPWKPVPQVIFRLGCVCECITYVLLAQKTIALVAVFVLQYPQYCLEESTLIKKCQLAWGFVQQLLQFMLILLV